MLREKRSDLCANHLKLGGGEPTPAGRRWRRADPVLAAVVAISTGGGVGRGGV